MNFGYKSTMDRYKLLKELGDGTCGTVYKAIDKETSEIVAVKKMKRKFYFWDECVNLREVKSLRRLIHPNIVKLKEVVRENNELFFIFEHMECNLYQLMKDRHTPLSEDEIRSFMTQILKGLAHMHKNGYFHRDMKPENLLVKNDVIKIADFGLAREVSSAPPYTDYVSTRWYRAPEVLLHSSTYTPAIDMWAVGAILAELFTLCPIFPGESEGDQLYKICCVLGAPNWTSFPEAKNTAQLVNISYSEFMPANLSELIPNASREAIDFIALLCTWDPRQRPTAEESLHHPFFHAKSCVPRPIHEVYQVNPISREPNLELNLWNFDSKPDECFLGLTLAVKPSVSNLANMAPSTSQQTRENILFSSGFHDHPQQAVFWSLFSPSRNPPVESSMSLSFSTMSHPPTGVAHSTGFTYGSLQPSLSSSLQQSHYL